MVRSCFIFVIVCLVFPGLVGCGPQMGQIYGKITFEGQPVTAGSIFFQPKASPDQFEAGRPASGVPNDKGEFQVSTFKKHDGALVGTHIVSYLPPAPPETSDPVLRAKLLEHYKKFGKCTLPANYTVEVKPGENQIELKLQRAPESPPE